MTLNEYQQLAIRTRPDLGTKLNIVHMLIGMFSEYEELHDAKDDVNAGEELTDKQWYLANYCELKSIMYEALSIDPIPVPNAEYFYMPLIYEFHLGKAILYMSKLQGAEKKFIAYNKAASNYDVGIICKEIFRNLEICYHVRGLDPDRCRENNINKLKVRYPDKFSEGRALNRDLDAERTELEK